MITEQEYLKSLTKLQEREKLSLLASENGKKFLEEYKKALETAKKDNKQIFLLFYMVGCDGCNVIKYLLDNNDSIKNILSNYIVLYYNATQTRSSLVQKYNIDSEKVIKQKLGIKVFDDPSVDFLAWLNS
jgi:thioredoxin-related protein